MKIYERKFQVTCTLLNFINNPHYILTCACGITTATVYCIHEDEDLLVIRFSDVMIDMKVKFECLIIIWIATSSALILVVVGKKITSNNHKNLVKYKFQETFKKLEEIFNLKYSGFPLLLNIPHCD